MKLFDYINKNEFEDMVAQGYINISYHPTVDGLRILCYSRECNDEKVWNGTTKKCRGLIVDKDDNIIARPFKKFFNYEEYNDEEKENIDGLACDFNPEIYEKLDGSLGILYWVDDVPYIATKGSFESDQAKHATHLLHTKYRHTWDNILRNKTYLFEIIYPEDLHVVSYPGVDELFLLAIISTENSFEYPVEIAKDYFPVAKKYYCNDWKNIRNIVDGTNREGFVVKIGPMRIKMKYEEYWRLHYLKAGLSEKMIRRCLVDGDMGPVNEALTMFDEEHVLYYKRIMDKYTDKFAEIIDKCVEEYRNDFETQKDAAAYFFTCRYPHILLRMYKGQPYEQITWKYVCREVKNTTDEDDY
jgi:RNA ligase